MKSKLYYTAILLTAGVFFFGLKNSVYAVDLTLRFTNTECLLTPAGGKVFNELDVKPLDTIEKTVQAVNESNYPASFSLSLKDPSILTRFFDFDPELSKVLWITISDADSKNVIYGPATISTWKDAGYIVLASDMPAKSVKNLLFKVTMDNVGNEYQGKTLQFDQYINCRGGAGGVAGDKDIRTPSVLGDSVTRLPETGVSLLIYVNGLGLVLSGLLLRKKRSAK